MVFVRISRRRSVAALVGATTLLTACGGASRGDADATLPRPAAEAPSTDPALASTPDSDPAESDTAEAVPAATELAPGEAPSTQVPTNTAAPATEAAPTEATPTATEAPIPALVEALLGGRSFASEVTTESQVLPDLLVDNIRSGTQINLRNVFPADRPVLIWMWAPH
jgi:hypothetical protein